MLRLDSWLGHVQLQVEDCLRFRAEGNLWQANVLGAQARPLGVRLDGLPSAEGTKCAFPFDLVPLAISLLDAVATIELIELGLSGILAGSSA